MKEQISMLTPSEVISREEQYAIQKKNIDEQVLIYTTNSALDKAAKKGERKIYMNGHFPLYFIEKLRSMGYKAETGSRWIDDGIDGHYIDVTNISW